MSFKSDFPILKNKVREYPITYLDSAASTQKPKKLLIQFQNFTKILMKMFIEE